MIPASADAGWIVPLIVVVVGFINWLVEKGKTPKPLTPTTRPLPGAKPRPSASAEEERMRKFLEALGVPSDEQPRRAPAQRQPQPLRQPQTPRSVVRKPAPVRPAPVLTDEPGDRAEPAPVLPLEALQLPALKVPEPEEFQTLASRVSAAPRGQSAPPNANTEALSRGENLRRELASPTQLRSAFLLREILGPPRSLQPQ